MADLSRRGFLRFLVAAPIVGAAAIKALTLAPPAHPIFSGELGVWQGVIFHQTERQMAREALKVWLAEQIDDGIFVALSAPSLAHDLRYGS